MGDIFYYKWNRHTLERTIYCKRPFLGVNSFLVILEIEKKQLHTKFAFLGINKYTDGSKE